MVGRCIRAIPTGQEFAPPPVVAIIALRKRNNAICTPRSRGATDCCLCAAAATAIFLVVAAAVLAARRTRSGIGIPAPSAFAAAAAAAPCHRERMLTPVGAGGGEILVNLRNREERRNAPTPGQPIMRPPTPVDD